MMARIALAALMLGLAACAPGAEPVVAATAPDAPQDDPDACGASRFLHLIGQPEAAARAAGLPQPVRFVCAGCPVTQNYAPMRLNVNLGRDGRVAGLSCG